MLHHAANVITSTLALSSGRSAKSTCIVLSLSPSVEATRSAPISRWALPLYFARTGAVLPHPASNNTCSGRRRASISRSKIL